MFRIIYFILAGLGVANIWAWSLFFVPPSGASGIYFLDVGQGDGELIAYDSLRFLVDAGRDGKTATELEKVLGDEKYLDAIFLTHADSDHVGGVYSVLDRYSVGVLLLGDGLGESWGDIISYADQKHVPVHMLAMRDYLSYKDARIDVLWPDPLYAAKTDNGESLVLRYTDGTRSALFTGDIDEAVEEILPRLFTVDADVLKVAHHGSKYASSREFLDAVSPVLSVIEVGKNSYGHPTNEALWRLGAVGSQILRTDQLGTIRVYGTLGSLRAQKVE